MAAAKFVIFLLRSKQGLHALYLEVHFDAGGKLPNHFLHCKMNVLFGVEGRADGSE